MRSLLDRIVNGLLRLAPWYRPAEIEQRERHSEVIHRYSIQSRIRAEAVLAQKRVGR